MSLRRKVPQMSRQRELPLEVRTLAAGCPATVSGGTCTVGTGCLAYSCGVANGNCAPCTGGGGPNPNGYYCRANVQLCFSGHTSSNCSDCASLGYNTEWSYGVSNGNILLLNPTTAIPGHCVVTAVPNY